MSDFKKKMEEKYPVPDRISPENMVNLIEEKKVSKKKRRIGILTSVTSVAACCAIVGTMALMLPEKNNKPDGDDNKPYVEDFKENNKVDGVINLEVPQSSMSYKEIYSILSEMYKDKQNLFIYENGFEIDGVLPDVEISEEIGGDLAPDGSINKGDAEISPGGQEDDFYETYEQVEGVAEADVIKTDGKFIYYLSGDCIYVINLDGEILSKTDVINTKSDYLNSEMFLLGNKLVYMYSKNYNDECSVSIYNISDAGVLTVENSFTQDGEYITSRLIGNKLYMVSYKYVWDFENTSPDDPVTFIPCYQTNEDLCTVKAENVFINNACEFSGYAVISQINIDDFSKTDVSTTFTNYPTVYCSKDNIYLISNFVKYNQPEDGQDFGYYFNYSNHCYITRFSLSEKLKLTGRNIVDGHILNQFSADEYDGYFRIATTRENDNALYVFDKDLKLCSTTGDMGKGEKIKSVNFSGEKAYIVTFRQTDPLYTIDLSDPMNPKILDELKVSGFSTHLRKYRDNLLIGFGNEADENSGFVTGVKLSMFEEDEKGKQTEIAKVAITSSEDCYYIGSPASYNHKYLLINSEKDIIGFPYVSYGDYIITDELGYDKEYYSFTDYFYILYNYTESGFEELCSVEVSDTDARAIYIGDVIYIFCKNEIILVDMSTGEIQGKTSLS